eukprot:2638700-Prorocentrum_lima.AAC.1
MTSSLVGSEMCIRDSPGRVSSMDLKPTGDLHELFRRLVDIESVSCLLYTSDAADECRSRWS